MGPARGELYLQRISKKTKMQKNLQTVLALLSKTKREIEIHSSDFDHLGLQRLALELARQDRVITLVVEDNLTNATIDMLVATSNDHFNLKLA